MVQNKGTFVLSLDTELVWGSFDLGIDHKLAKDFINTRSCIDRLLELLNKYQLSATFAMVGHLMLDKCSMEDGIKHKEIVRPKHDWYEKDWFDEDPASSIVSDPIWYGTDILKKITSSEPRHEIASHSFSHMIFGDKGCSAESAESDIREAVKTAYSWGINLTTFIFPRNSEGHKDILKKYGFKAYRAKGNEWFNSIRNKRLRQFCHLLDNFLGLAPRTSDLYKDEHGLYRIVGNMLYLSRTGITISSRVRKARKGIDLAIKKGEIFHLWFHPFNLASDPEGLLKGLESIFKYVRMKMDNGLMDNYTIDGLCRQYELVNGK